MTRPDARCEDRYYAGSDGVRLHLRDYRPAPTAGPPVVCLAGLTRSADDFDELARFLAFEAPQGRRVVALDYRGRGQSAHCDDWRRYDLATEWDDVLAALRFCAIDAAHFIGTSRGGLHLMAAARDHRHLMRSAVLNDIGPVLERDGLARIRGYVGRPVSPPDLAAAVAMLKIGNGDDFTGLSEREWLIFATTTFGTDEARLGLRYDPALRHSLEELDLSKPLPDLWDAFDALRGLPVLTIRAENSDILSDDTLSAMGARWPASETYTVLGQGHAPLLADHASLARIARFLAEADRRCEEAHPS